ncbi:MAG: hypothetical protein KAY24_08815, partial [Candidatus Eisenbacteria sp.]|nr:hypothetical protein [Candidatus Eisenbacteria bacterium]
MTLGSRTRLKLLLGLSSSLLLLLLARGAYLTLFQHPEISTFVHRQQTDPIEEPGVRGPILDRTGRTLACTLENPSVAVRLNKESDQRRLLGSLVEAGVCSEERSRKVARSGGRGFFWLYRSWISSDVLDRVPTTWHEVEIVPEAKRFYPSGIVAPALVGIVGQEGHGLSGLEWRYDKWLSGRPGRTLQFVTGGGYLDNAPPPMILEEPEPGGGLQLTIDSRMQMIARHRLREGMQRVEALTGFVILMDPWTGEVLAMCEEPSFDPLDDASVVTEQLKAHPVSDQ